MTVLPPAVPAGGALDPVCGMQIQPASAAGSRHRIAAESDDRERGHKLQVRHRRLQCALPAASGIISAPLPPAWYAAVQPPNGVRT
jgi:hypothetical protein